MDEQQNFKNKWIVLVVTVAITFMSSLDSSIVNVALPDMAEKLKVDTAAISWTVSIYLIVIVA
ncbi:MAG: MFS transporter, partial [Oscillospiraceae bacterium]|nr:MFS transporter [Oscillospiraceae bacterium]